jgi:GH35 family endo-1,4-beta-xylanase
VNEAAHLPDKINKTRMAAWGLAKGSLRYVSEHLHIAREANPHATLLINDYRLDPPYYQLLEKVLNERPRPLDQALDERRRFDCVGIQSHMHDGPWSIPRTWDVCETYQRLGLPLHFTETTFVSGPRKGRGENWGDTTAELEETQALATERFYTVLFSNPAVQAITWWDFSDRGAWQGAPAGWVRKDMSPKPVYERMLALIRKQWWTKVSGQTDANGDFTTRAFYGSYRLTVEAPARQTVTKQLQWRPGAPNRISVTV